MHTFDRCVIKHELGASRTDCPAPFYSVPKDADKMYSRVSLCSEPTPLPIALKMNGIGDKYIGTVPWYNCTTEQDPRV